MGLRDHLEVESPLDGLKLIHHVMPGFRGDSASQHSVIAELDSAPMRHLRNDEFELCKG